MGLSLAAGFHRDGFFNPSPIFRKGRRGDRIDHNPALAPTFENAHTTSERPRRFSLQMASCHARITFMSETPARPGWYWCFFSFSPLGRGAGGGL